MDSSAIIGFVLFILSEILPLINIKSNGIFHSLLLGLGNAFKNNTLIKNKDIELAESLINTKTNYANIINTINTNHQIRDVIEHLLINPQNPFLDIQI